MSGKRPLSQRTPTPGPPDQAQSLTVTASGEPGTLRLLLVHQLRQIPGTLNVDYCA